MKYWNGQINQLIPNLVVLGASFSIVLKYVYCVPIQMYPIDSPQKKIFLFEFGRILR